VRLQQRLDSYVAGSGTPGAVVGISTRGDREVAASGIADLTTGRPVSPATPFRIASLTKTFTAAATVLACRSSSHPLSAPIRELAPRLAEDWQSAPDLSLEQVLAQVSGLRDDVDSATMAALGEGDDALLAGARSVAAAGQAHEPGRQWSYYNGNYFLAGAVLAEITGTSYESALRRFVLEPWGLTGTGFATPPDGAVGHVDGRPVEGVAYPRSRRPSGGLWSTIGDLLTAGESVLGDADLLTELRRPRTPPPSSTRYGLSWALGDARQLYVNGRLTGYRAVYLIVPEHEVVVAMLANDVDALPSMAAFVSDLQLPVTGDDLAAAIDVFAA
jgi:D-alanyl-D-alanine carboxypeptidase